MDLTNMLMDLDDMDEPPVQKVIKAPFAYPGGKSRSIKYILPHLPRTDRFCDAFAGSGVVLLNRKPVKMEVYNDRHSGVTAFFRCMQDKDKYDQLIDLMEWSIHSREEFELAKATWDTCRDDVYRAFYWFYHVTYSFGSLGRNFGRATQNALGRLSGRVFDRAQEMQAIRNRFKAVQVENMDIFQLLKDYDHEDMVFYLDPPYLASSKGIYKWEMTTKQHERLIDTIFQLKGFVAISGYTHPLYEGQPWTNRYEWESLVSMDSPNLESNNKGDYRTSAYRDKALEVLWIKDFKK